MNHVTCFFFFFLQLKVLYYFVFENLLRTKSCDSRRVLVVSPKGCRYCCRSWRADAPLWGGGAADAFLICLWCVWSWGGGGRELGRVCSGAGCSGHHCRLVLLARWGHVMLWGCEGPRGPSPEADPYLFVCLFPRATEPGRGIQPP